MTATMTANMGGLLVQVKLAEVLSLLTLVPAQRLSTLQYSYCGFYQYAKHCPDLAANEM